MSGHLSELDSTQANPWNRKVCIQELHNQFFNIIISIDLRYHVSLVPSGKSCQSLMIYTKIIPISRSPASFSLSHPKALSLFMTPHHMWLRIIVEPKILHIFLSRVDTAPSPRLVLRSPPMAPLRIPKVTEVSSCSPIASDGLVIIRQDVKVGINISNKRRAQIRHQFFEVTWTQPFFVEELCPIPPISFTVPVGAFWVVGVKVDHDPMTAADHFEVVSLTKLPCYGGGFHHFYRQNISSQKEEVEKLWKFVERCHTRYTQLW